MAKYYCWSTRQTSTATRRNITTLKRCTSSIGGRALRYSFPASNFEQQEPGTDAEIKTFCYTKYSLPFPLFSRISVKGDDKHPLYRYLTEQSQFPGEVGWNFQKYLVDRSGKVVARHHHRTKPLTPEVVQDVTGALGPLTPQVFR